MQKHKEEIKSLWEERKKKLERRRMRSRGIEPDSESDHEPKYKAAKYSETSSDL